MSKAKKKKSKGSVAKKAAKRAQPREECALVCPRCGTYWARMRFSYGAVVRSADIDVLVGVEKRLPKDAELACAECHYAYNTHDVIVAIADTPTTLKPVEKIPVPADAPEFDQDGGEIVSAVPAPGEAVAYAVDAAGNAERIDG